MEDGRRINWARILVGLFALVAAGALLMPLFRAAEIDYKAHDISNLKQSGTWALIYAADHDDHGVQEQQWVDRLNVYAKNVDVFRCGDLRDAAKDKVFGHALHRHMAGADYGHLENPAREVLLFDCTDLTKSAVAELAQIPPMGRNKGHNRFLFVDNHVKTVKPGDPPWGR